MLDWIATLHHIKQGLTLRTPTYNEKPFLSKTINMFKSIFVFEDQSWVLSIPSDMCFQSSNLCSIFTKVMFFNKHPS